MQEDPDVLKPRTFVVCKWVATCIEEKSHGKGHSMSTWQEFALMPCKSVLIIMDTQIKFGSYVVMTLGCKLRIVGQGNNDIDYGVVDLCFFVAPNHICNLATTRNIGVK